MVRNKCASVQWGSSRLGFVSSSRPWYRTSSTCLVHLDKSPSAGCDMVKATTLDPENSVRGVRRSRRNLSDMKPVRQMWRRSMDRDRRSDLQALPTHLTKICASSRDRTWAQQLLNNGHTNNLVEIWTQRDRNGEVSLSCTRPSSLRSAQRSNY